jgi:hypothetical protein
MKNQIQLQDNFISSEINIQNVICMLTELFRAFQAKEDLDYFAELKDIRKNLDYLKIQNNESYEEIDNNLVAFKDLLSIPIQEQPMTTTPGLFPETEIRNLLWKKPVSSGSPQAFIGKLFEFPLFNFLSSFFMAKEGRTSMANPAKKYKGGFVATVGFYKDNYGRVHSCPSVQAAKNGKFRDSYPVGKEGTFSTDACLDFQFTKEDSVVLNAVKGFDSGKDRGGKPCWLNFSGNPGTNMQCQMRVQTAVKEAAKDLPIGGFVIIVVGSTAKVRNNSDRKFRVIDVGEFRFYVKSLVKKDQQDFNFIVPNAVTAPKAVANNFVAAASAASTNGLF